MWAERETHPSTGGSPRRAARWLGGLLARVRLRDRPADRPRPDRSAPDDHDVVVIGAGICGLVLLSYARRAGLRCVALEKQDEVGGLWNRLPAWQDAQNRREDFAINSVPLRGVRQPGIVEHAQAWVGTHDLAPHSRLGCEATSTEHRDGRWHVHTTDGFFIGMTLLDCTAPKGAPRS